MLYKDKIEASVKAYNENELNAIDFGYMVSHLYFKHEEELQKYERAQNECSLYKSQIAVFDIHFSVIQTKIQHWKSVFSEFSIKQNFKTTKDRIDQKLDAKMSQKLVDLHYKMESIEKQAEKYRKVFDKESLNSDDKNSPEDQA